MADKKNGLKHKIFNFLLMGALVINLIVIGLLLFYAV
jgi:hypothetical protein